MTTNRFHKAAKDGLIEVLREASRKECNSRDEAGMTPTLWASFEGHVEALRLLCGRGGEPDKADHYGNTALHLAAARGHSDCVAFLVNFGANPFALDVDRHTPQELAAINGRDEILRYLDQAAARLENNDRKKTKSMKEKARKENEKYLKQYQKRQTEAEQAAGDELKRLTREWEKDEPVSVQPHRPSTVLAALKSRMMRSSSHGNLLDEQPRPTYSALVGTVSSGTKGRGAVYKKALASKMRHGTLTNNNDDFKVGEVESTGRRSVTSLTGLRRDSEVMYVGTFGASAATQPQQRANVADVFGQEEQMKPLSARSTSQPSLVALSAEGGPAREVLMQEPASIFDRPGFGSVAFRRSITATLGTLPAGAGGEDLSIGSAGSLAARQSYQPTDWHDDESSTLTSISGSDDGEAEDGFQALERFLTAWGLAAYAPRLRQEQIDLDALMLLTETDLRQLALPLGPHRKLVTAVAERRAALARPGPLTDTPV